MNSFDSSSIHVRTYVEAVFRQWKKLLVFNLLVVLLVIAVIFGWPRKYQSEAKLWIKLGRENTKLDPTASTGETISIQETDREDEIRSVMDVVVSRGVASRAVESLSPEVVLGDAPLPGGGDGKEPNVVAEQIKHVIGSAIDAIKQIDPISDREEAIIEITEKIEVDAERKSNVVSLKYEAETPALAQAIIGEVIEQYKLEHARIHYNDGSQGFFSDQLDTLRKRVADSADALRLAKNELGIASIEGQRVILESEMQNVRTARLEQIRALSDSKAQITELTSLLAKQPERISSEKRSVPNSGRDNLRTRLYELQVQRMEMEARWNADHPMLQAIIAQEEEARSELAEDTTAERNESVESINTIHQELSLQVARAKAATAGYRATLDALAQQEEQVINSIAELNRADIDINRLQRDLRLAEANYTTYADNYEDARLDEEFISSAISNIGIAQLPTFQEKPVSPSKMLVGLFGIAMMCSGSVVIVAGSVLLSSTVNQPQDLEEVLTAPVMVSVPNEPQYSEVLS